MDCRDVTEYLLSADNDAAPPVEIAHHLDGCLRCRREFSGFMKAVAVLQAAPVGAAGEIEMALTARVMRAVRQEAERREPVVVVEEQPTGLRSWVIVGSIILAGLFGLRFSDAMSWLRQSFGPAIDVAMSVILGLFLTAYICVLVGSNLNKVRRAFGLK